MLKTSLKRVRELVVEHKDLITKLSTLLMDKETLSGDEFRSIVTEWKIKAENKSSPLINSNKNQKS